MFKYNEYSILSSEVGGSENAGHAQILHLSVLRTYYSIICLLVRVQFFVKMENSGDLPKNETL